MRNAKAYSFVIGAAIGGLVGLAWIIADNKADQVLGWPSTCMDREMVSVLSAAILVRLLTIVLMVFKRRFGHGAFRSRWIPRNR
jgi:hypothetical protein